LQRRAGGFHSTASPVEVTIAAAASLLYASIDPEEESRPAFSAPAGSDPAYSSTPRPAHVEATLRV